MWLLNTHTVSCQVGELEGNKKTCASRCTQDGDHSKPKGIQFSYAELRRDRPVFSKKCDEVNMIRRKWMELKFFSWKLQLVLQ